MEKEEENLSVPYFRTGAILLLSGTFFILCKYEVEVIRFIALAVAIIGCMFINIFYLIPTSKRFVRYVLPGIVTIGLSLLINGSGVEERFFLFFGIANLVIGTAWFIIKQKSQPK